MSISRGLPGLSLEEMMNQLEVDTTGEPGGDDTGEMINAVKELPTQVGQADAVVTFALDQSAEWASIDIPAQSDDSADPANSSETSD